MKSRIAQHYEIITKQVFKFLNFLTKCEMKTVFPNIVSAETILF